MMSLSIQVTDLYSSGQEIRLIKVNVKHKELFSQRYNFYLFGCSYSCKSSTRNLHLPLMSLLVSEDLNNLQNLRAMWKL